jgi:hypothetical protein
MHCVVIGLGLDEWINGAEVIGEFTLPVCQLVQVYTLPVCQLVQVYTLPVCQLVQGVSTLYTNCCLPLLALGC